MIGPSAWFVRRDRGAVPVLLIAAAASVGAAAAWWYGSLLPEWTDPATAERIFVHSCDLEGRVRPGWFETRARLGTWRWPLLDGARAALLLVASLSALWFCVPKCRSRPATPDSAGTYFIVGTVAAILYAIACWHSIVLDQSRRVFPPCADSIAIPFFGLIAATPIMLVLLLGCGWLVSRGFGRLPVPLFAWDRDRPVLWWLCSLACGLAGLVVLAMLGEALTTSMFLAVPSCVAGLYLLAATRAALLAPTA